MGLLKWTTEHAVFVPEIDDEHKEVFEAVSKLQTALSTHAPLPEVCDLTQRLTLRAAGHFDHEERLMRAARYGSLRWHKQQHDAARKRVRQFALDLEQGDLQAGIALVEYLTSWLPEHARLPDRMMGAYLRNRERQLFKVTFRAGTKPADACDWVDSKGDRFDPRAPRRRH